MLATLAIYGSAAYFDWRDRRVPNTLWLVGGVVFLASNASFATVASSLFVFLAGAAAWWRGGFGGADVKAIGMVPLAMPASWPAVLLGAAGLTTGWILAGRRDEVPFCIPLALAVVTVGLGVAYF